MLTLTQACATNIPKMYCDVDLPNLTAVCVGQACASPQVCTQRTLARNAAAQKRNGRVANANPVAR